MTALEMLPNRTVIRIGGEDRRSFLQGVVTQDLAATAKGAAVFSALLTPQGKVLADFNIVDDGEIYLLDAYHDGAEALIKRLTLYKLRAKVSIEIDDSLAVAASEREITAPGALAFPDPRLAALGWRAIIEANAASGAGDYDTRRIALGVTEFGADFGPDEMFLLDVNYDALHGVSYKKGCFIGQEVSSRMRRKGEPRRRTLIAAFDGPEPEKGAKVIAGDSTLGEILHAADGHALALIRMDRWEKAKTEDGAPECEGLPLRLLVPAYLKQD